MCHVRFAILAAFAIHAATMYAAEPAAKSGDPSKLPATVAADLKSVGDLCSDAGGKPGTADAVQRVDLNGDGNEDFVLYVGNVHCDGAASVYGDREKSVTVYAGDGKGGAVSAFNDSVYDAKVERSGAAPALWLGVSGERCGKKPARDFASESFCDRPLQWNGAAKKFDYAPVTTVRMIE